MGTQFLLVFLVSQLNSISMAPPPCATGVTCPPNGIWSEWTTTGDGECSMPCGSCAKTFQTRTCRSSSISNCPCVGASSRYIPCNTQACSFPSQRTCCIPYVPMIRNGTQICGPLPSTTSTGASCCPAGGLWTPWSGYQKSSSGWMSTRLCLSDSAGCPCSGDTVRNLGGCPCGQPANADSCTQFTNNQPYYYRNLIIDQDNCQAFLPMVGHNDGADYCHTYTSYRYYDYVALLLMKDENGACFTDIVFDCMNGERADRWMNASFSCDTTTMNWVYDWNGKQVTAYSQGIYPSTA